MSDGTHIRVTGVTVLVKARGADEILVDTDLPSPFPITVSSDPLSLKSSVRAGGAIEYAQKHFPGVPLTIIDMDSGERKTI
tara:strand:- start:153 stop:395 length:243 start_codon:yes stop_codon:yes gene_type:complete